VVNPEQASEPIRMRPAGAALEPAWVRDDGCQSTWRAVGRDGEALFLKIDRHLWPEIERQRWLDGRLPVLEVVVWTKTRDGMGWLMLALFAEMELIYTAERATHARAVSEGAGRRAGRPIALPADKISAASLHPLRSLRLLCHLAMFLCFSSSVCRLPLAASVRNMANRDTRNRQTNCALRPFPVGVLLKDTNCHDAPCLAATNVSSPLGEPVSSFSPANSTAPLP
jgi:hypothetical protein